MQKILYSAVDISKYIIHQENKKNKTITNMRLQKLLYVCYARYLNKYQVPLFFEDIYAWEYGPVIPNVYYCYRSFAQSHINTEHREFLPNLSGEAMTQIDEVLNEFNNMSTYSLVDLTHQSETPWSKTVRNSIIQDDVIKEYYAAGKKSGL